MIVRRHLRASADGAPAAADAAPADAAAAAAKAERGAVAAALGAALPSGARVHIVASALPPLLAPMRASSASLHHALPLMTARLAWTRQLLASPSEAAAVLSALLDSSPQQPEQPPAAATDARTDTALDVAAYLAYASGEIPPPLSYGPWLRAALAAPGGAALCRRMCARVRAGWELPAAVATQCLEVTARRRRRRAAARRSGKQRARSSLQRRLRRACRCLLECASSGAACGERCRRPRRRRRRRERHERRRRRGGWARVVARSAATGGGRAQNDTRASAEH